METLRKMQKERLREERLTTAQPREIGFVSQARSARAPNAPSSPITLCTATPGEPHTANSTNDRSAILARKSSPEAGDRANR
jgi:hypothetical protein